MTVGFYDNAYVDLTDGPGAAEAVNLNTDLTALGFQVSTFTGVTTAAWTAALADAQVLAVPELEHDLGLAGDLEPGAVAAIQDFVSGGGLLVVFSGIDLTFLNTVFGLVLTGPSGTVGCERLGGGTPATLANLDATWTVEVSSLPAGATVIYQETGNAAQACVAVWPNGLGKVLFMGWDWYQGDPDPAGDQDDWIQVLGEVIDANAAEGPAAPVEAQPDLTG